MMTRREINTVLGTTFAAFISGTIALLRAEAAQHDAQGHADSNPRGITSLIHESIGNLGDSEATMLMLTLQPQSSSTPHKHPGPVFAYVLEGRVENQVDPEEPKTYAAGDFWYEPAMHVHRTFRNLSDTELARVLVFMVVPKGSPAGIPAK